MTDLRSRIQAVFREAFGGAPDLVARAPGRVNLMGDHTDYNDGFVLPVAIGVETMVAARKREDRQVTVVAADVGNARSTFALDAPIAHAPDQPWSNYVRGVLATMQADGLELTGADMVVAGTIPQGSGLSSSASMEVAVATAFAALAGLSVDPTRLALLAQAAENDFVGTRCGVMDQLASARGEPGHALLIDCRSLDCRPIGMPGDIAILIVHSGISRGLGDGAYNNRRAQCEAVARLLGIKALRDATLDVLEAARSDLDPTEYAVARHVITENERTLAAAAALERGDLPALGILMRQSHASMRDDFAISVPAVDQLVALLQEAIGQAGGARMTGGGFGGAVVALLAGQEAERVTGSVTRGYRTPAGEAPMILLETASQGAGLLN